MKKIILFAIIVTLLIPAFSIAGDKYDENDLLVHMLKDLKGEFLEGDLNMGGVLLEEFLSIEEMEMLSEKIKNKLGVIGEEMDFNRDISEMDGEYYAKDVIYDDEFHQVSIYGYDQKKNPITIIISSYLNPEFNESETTVFVNLIKREKNFKINDIIGVVENIFREYGKPVDITTCVIGTLEGKIKDSSLDKSVSKAIKQVKGRIVEEYIDSEISSYMIYTPFIESSIFSGEKKVNLNLAIRYNEYENKTYIWIGTPIITTGY